MHGIRERVTSPLSAAEATLLGRIAAARGSAVAGLRACVAQLRSGALATALAGFAGAAGAGAEIVHCGVHRKLLGGWLDSTDIGCPRECIVFRGGRSGLKGDAALLEQTRWLAAAQPGRAKGEAISKNSPRIITDGGIPN